MSNLQHDIAVIRDCFALLESSVNQDSVLGLNDINIICEKHFSSVFSVLYRSKFELTGERRPNFEAIDLISEKIYLTVQITTSTTSQKVKDTLLTYVKKDFHKDYDRIIILFLSTVDKPNVSVDQILTYINSKYEGESINQEDLKFDPVRDCMNLSDLRSEIYYKCTEDEIKSISLILDKAFKKYNFQTNININIDDIKLRSLNLELESLSIIDSIEKISDFFYPILVLPKSILLNLYPFKKLYLAQYRRWTLFTDNEKLLEFISSLRNKDLNTKEKHCIQFLMQQNVHYVGDMRRAGLSDGIGSLIEDEKCPCEKCRYNRFEFNLSSDKLDESFRLSKSKIFEGLRRASVLFKMDRYSDCFELLKRLKKYTSEKKLLLAEFIIGYNLEKLISISPNVRNNSIRKKIREYSKNIDLNKLESKIKKELPYSEVIKCLKHIRQSDFVFNALLRSISNSEESSELYFNDQYGGWSSYKNYFALINELADFYGFVERNQLLYFEFTDYSKIFEVNFETAIALNELQNPISFGLRPINNYFLIMWLQYSDPKRLLNILNKYEVKSLKYENKDQIFPNLSTLSKNLKRSVTFLNETIKQKREEESEHKLSRNINTILSNFFLLLLVINLEKSEFNRILKNLIYVVNKFRYFNFNTISYLNRLVNYKAENIEDTNAIALLRIDNRFIRPDILMDLNLNVFLKRATFNSERREFLKSKIEFYSKKENLEKSNLPYHELIDFAKFCNGNEIRTIKKIIRLKLEKHFNYVTFINASLNGLVEFEKFEDQYLSTIPKKSGEVSLRSSFRGVADRIHGRLNEFIHLAYHLSLDLSKAKYQELKLDDPYYEWLFSPEEFNYDNFNPYWLLEYRSHVYYERFKSISALGIKIKERLLERPNRELERIYLEYFC